MKISTHVCGVIYGRPISQKYYKRLEAIREVKQDDNFFKCFRCKWPWTWFATWISEPKKGSVLLCLNVSNLDNKTCTIHPFLIFIFKRTNWKPMKRRKGTFKHKHFQFLVQIFQTETHFIGLHLHLALVVKKQP